MKERTVEDKVIRLGDGAVDPKESSPPSSRGRRASSPTAAADF